MPYEPWVAVPTLVCSTLSAVATGAVILMWLFSSHDEKHSFRYALVMNLTIAGKQQASSVAVALTIMCVLIITLQSSSTHSTTQSPGA